MSAVSMGVPLRQRETFAHCEDSSYWPFGVLFGGGGGLGAIGGFSGVIARGDLPVLAQVELGVWSFSGLALSFGAWSLSFLTCR